MNERSLKDMFFLVGQLIPETQELIIFPPEMLVSEALGVMCKKNISQAPVLERGVVLGVFSYRSLAQGLLKLPGNERSPQTLAVEEFLEQLSYAQITDKVTTLLGEFDLKDAVLAGSRERLQGIITAVDALQYFYRAARPYIMLREIELAIRELMRASVEDSELKKCVDRSLKEYCEKSGRAVPDCLEQMTMTDYITLLRFRGTWDRFKEAFGESSDLVHARLEPIPDTRNAVFHFKREISMEEYDHLRDTRDWLLERVTKMEARKESQRSG
jgi:CBS domain-containing protein